MSSARVARVEREAELALIVIRDIFGPMHWQPASLLVQLVEQGRTIAQWDAESGAGQ
jgi:hypothetical protein